MKTGTTVAGGIALTASTSGATPGSGPAPRGDRLPNLPRGSRLLFQGDSITDMKWGRNENDRNHYLGHSYVYLLAARLGVEMAAAQLDFRNRGNSGDTVGDLRKRWQSDAIELEPDLLSVLVGVNDIERGVSPEAYERDFRHILTASRSANPELRLVLLAPFVLPTGKLADRTKWSEYRGMVEALGIIVAKLAADFDAVHVRTQKIFDEALETAPADHWIWDGLHPLPQGHELIARAWLAAVSARWPNAG